MNGFRGCGKGSQGDLPAPTVEMFPTVHPAENQSLLSKNSTPPPAEKRDTETIPVLGSGCTTRAVVQVLAQPLNWVHVRTHAAKSL